MYHSVIMSKKIRDMLAEIGADLGSPQVVADIDQAINALTGLRKVAVSLHGGASPAALEMPEREVRELDIPAEKSSKKPFDGTLKGLEDLYRADPSFLKNRYKTKEHYSVLMKEIRVDCGDDKPIAAFKMKDIERLHKGWERTRGENMAHALIIMFRTMIYFGSTVLQDADCERLSVVLHRMRFPTPKHRAISINAEQAVAVRKEAHKLARPSVALAQAFQFDCDLSQTDVVGEWVPVSEPGESDIEYAGNKWLRGIRWEEIDEKLILRHRTSKGDRLVVADLNNAPMVIEELEIMFGNSVRASMPWTGPVIVCEPTEQPWFANEFRRYWRKAADIANIPRDVKNRTSKKTARARKADMENDDIDLSLELGASTTPH